jgi:hypothetical protein
MGRLLEYAFREGGLEPAGLTVVGEPALDEFTARYLERLRSSFSLPIEYLQIALTSDDSSD